MTSLTRFASAVRVAAIGAIVLAPALIVRAADRMTAGQWEFTMSRDGDSRTVKQCITPAKANEMNGDTATARAFAEKSAKGRCTIKSYDIQGDVVKYSLACGDRTIDSVTTFHGETSEGTMKTATAGGAVDVQTVKARRLGPCP